MKHLIHQITEWLVRYERDLNGEGSVDARIYAEGVGTGYEGGYADCLIDARSPVRVVEEEKKQNKTDRLIEEAAFLKKTDA